MKYRFSLNVPDTRKCIEKDISLLLFSENEPRDTLSYIKNPLLKKKMLVTYKYIKRNEKHGNVCTSAKSYAKLNFMRINEQQTEVSADVISKRKKFSFSDMLLLLISIGVATVTFFVSLAFIFGRMSDFLFSAVICVLSAGYTAFMLSRKQWFDEPKEDPTERIETLLAELFKDEQFCEKID